METSHSHKNLSQHFERVSDKMVHHIHKSHEKKLIFHTRSGLHLLKMPLLLGIMLFLLLPILIGLILTIFLYYGGGLFIEKEE